MQQLAYTSMASPRIGSDDVFRIVETSARNNPAREITGFLVFGEGEFLQVVEGPEEQLDRLLSDLSRDTRHHSISVVERQSIAGRRFESWRMKRIAPGQSKADVAELLARLGDRPGSQAIIGEARRLLRV